MRSYAPRMLAVLALAVPALASPTPVPQPAPEPAETTSAVSLQPTDAWVSVNSDGVATTITPVLTTVDGTPTVVSAAPTTTTGTSSTTLQPEATATNGAGSFPVCSNKNGYFAPFCAPSDGSTLNPGVTYYVTWDPRFFSTSAPNTTVIITGNLFNASTGDITTQAFSSDVLAAGWSFYAWTVDKALLNGASSQGVNISIAMSYLSSGNVSTHLTGPVVRVSNPEPYRQKPAELPQGAALYIGLPCIVGFIAIMLVGTCIWNRRTRAIGLGNIMSRSRFGDIGAGFGRSKGYGIRKSRRQRVGAVHLDSKDAIRLQKREVRAPGEASNRGAGAGGNADDSYMGVSRATTHADRDASPYTDASSKNDGPPTLALSGDHWTAAPPERPRRDSDALGSLAGSPTEERFRDFHRPRTARGDGNTGTNGGGNSGNSGSTGNAFRDELWRQDNLI